MKIINHDAVFIPAHIDYIVEFVWKNSSDKCEVVFDTLEESSFYEDAIKSGKLQVVYTRYYGPYQEYDRLILVYANQGVPNVEKSFSHDRYLWQCLAGYVDKFPSDSLFCAIPCCGQIRSSAMDWAKFVEDEWADCDPPYKAS